MGRSSHNILGIKPLYTNGPTTLSLYPHILRELIQSPSSQRNAFQFLLDLSSLPEAFELSLCAHVFTLRHQSSTVSSSSQLLLPVYSLSTQVLLVHLKFVRCTSPLHDSHPGELTSVKVQ